MRLLLTRSAEDAKRTRQKLVALGHHVTIAPVIDIVPSGTRWPNGLVDGVLATSAHAFDTLAADTGPVPEARRLMPLLIVGGRTEDAARGRGFTGEAIVAASAAELAKLIDTMGRSWRRIVYLAGRDRKPNAETALIAKGHIVDVIETYEARIVNVMAPSVRAALCAGHVDGVLHFSRRSAGLFLMLMTNEGLSPEGLRHFCLSEDVATLLREAGCGFVTAAEEPVESALLSLLLSESVV